MNIKLKLAAIGLGTGCLLCRRRSTESRADQSEPKVQVTSKTEHIDFPSGGTLRFKNSVGVLSVEAWDRPDVEITTIKSTRVETDAGKHDKAMRDLDRVSITTERRGDELVVTTEFPAHRPFRLPYPLSGEISFNLEYRVKAPATARIIADHTLGQVNIDGLIDDIQVNLAQGEILLHLPEDQKYNIHAQSDFGNVNSDFSGQEKRTGWLLGHRSVDENSGAPHKLNLRVGFGDIVILKIRVPKFPDTTATAPKTEGL